MGLASNEVNINVMRPFSKVWADVSLPLLIKSIYATLFLPKTLKQLSPFGERLILPFLFKGAVATKKICCFSINSL
jgi:hypothetical protein